MRTITAMRISLNDLKAFRKAPAPLPALVDPRLELVEELVLLSLRADQHRG